MPQTVLLVVDIGNTNISLGIFDYESGAHAGELELAQHWRISTHREQTSDELSITLRSLFVQEGREADEVTDIIISSVVPPLVPVWERACSTGAPAGKRLPPMSVLL